MLHLRTEVTSRSRLPTIYLFDKSLQKAVTMLKSYGFTEVNYVV